MGLFRSIYTCPWSGIKRCTGFAEAENLEAAAAALLPHVDPDMRDYVEIEQIWLESYKGNREL